MTPIPTKQGEILMVEVPDDRLIRVDRDKIVYQTFAIRTEIDFPPGVWHKVLDTKDPKGEDAKKFVEYYGNGMYQDYELGFMMGYKRTALESFNSLLKHHSLDPEKRHIGLKKK